MTVTNATGSINTSKHKPKSQVAQRLGWWFLLLISVFYSLYAVAMAGTEIALRLGLVEDAPNRSISLIFIIHALSGAVVLVTGVLQFNRKILQKRHALHRTLGKTYVVTVWLSSLGGLLLALTFDASLISKVIFTILALLWFGATTLAYLYARRRKFKQHREWMIRSYALSFFFVTFSFWVEGVATLVPSEIAYPIAVFVSWGLNLLISEIWIRRTR